MDFIGNIAESIPAVQMVAESKTAEEEQQIYMMDASAFNMHEVAEAVAELDELPDWVGGEIEEYFPRESLQINDAGEIIITLKHGDSTVLITPDHSLYARLKAIIDSGASVCIFNERKFFSDFTEHPMKIRTAGTPIMVEGYGTVGKLQNCLLVKGLQKNLISVSHVCKDMKAYFVTDNVRCICLEKGTNKVLHECNMADGLYSTYDLEWLGINILDAAPDLMVTPDKSRMIRDYIEGTAMEAMAYQVDVVQEARRS